MCLSQQQEKPENLLREKGGGKKREGEGREAESESGFQTEALQLLVYCNYSATEEIKP